MISSTKLFWMVSAVMLTSITLQTFALFLWPTPLTLAALALSVVGVALALWQGYRSADEMQRRFEQEQKEREQGFLNERAQHLIDRGRPSYEPIFAAYRAMQLAHGR